MVFFGVGAGIGIVDYHVGISVVVGTVVGGVGGEFGLDRGFGPVIVVVIVVVVFKVVIVSIIIIVVGGDLAQSMRRLLLNGFGESFVDCHCGAIAIIVLVLFVAVGCCE